MQDALTHDDCKHNHKGACSGAAEHRSYSSYKGVYCDKHWDDYCDMRQGVNARYPTLQPVNFDPTYAGESWDED